MDRGLFGRQIPVVKVKKTVSIDVGAVADELSELSELSYISDAEDDVGA